MRKIFVFGFILILIFSTPVFAHEGGAASVNLGIGNPLILPTNPLYFFKELGRDLERLFAFKKETKIRLELDILNAKAAEVKSLVEKDDADGVLKAFQKYKRSAEILAKKIQSLRDSGAAESLVADFTAKVLAHHELFEEVLRHSDEFNEELENVRKVLDGAGTAIIEEIGDTDKFNRLFEGAVADYEDGSLKEFNAVHVLDRIQPKLPEEAQSKVGALKDNLILRFEGRFQAEANEDFIEALDDLTIPNPDGLKVLDEIREKVTNTDLRSKLNVVRQKAFLNLEGSSIASREAAEETIASAESAISILEKQVSSGGSDVAKAVKELLEMADFHLEQAKKFFGEGGYGPAFGQATAALAEAENGLDQIGKDSNDLSLQNFDLRKEFDELKTQAKFGNLTPEVAPDLYALFDRAEKKVLEAKTIDALRDAKVLLVEIEAKIRARIDQ